MPATSKRKSSGSDADKHGKKHRKGSDGAYVTDNSVFGELIRKQGFLLTKGNCANEMVKDQAVFQRDLSRAVKRHQDFPQVVDEFIEGLYKHIENPTNFFWSLMPTATAADAEESARGGNQESLMRLCLAVENLQPAVMNMLLEKLAEFTGDEEPILHNNERVNLPRLIMNQFRWLDHIVNSQEVTKKMLEILCIVSMETQREVITCIPEVVDDADHNTVAKELRDLLVQQNQLAVPILDALSNLSLRQDLFSEVRGSVIQSLSSVEIDDLPVIVRFLLQTIDGKEAVQIISELRQHLDFNSSIPPDKSSTPNTSRTVRHRNISNPDSAKGSEALTLDAIRSGVRFQKCIAEGWIKAIEAVRSAAEHKVVDIFVLLILHSSNHRKSVESLLRNKIRAGHFTEVLLHAAFGSHAQVLREYFLSVMSLAEVLLRSPEHPVYHFGSAMYKHAFNAFDPYCQQEIVGSLVTHIGSGFAGEVDASLDILADLVEANVAKMTPFTVFVKGVLDYIDNLSMAQIRKLYSTLSILAFRNPNEEGMIQDEIHIMIRKQLANNTPKYKRMGVIGAIMVVKSMACVIREEQTFDQTVTPVLNKETQDQVTSLLKLVQTSCLRSPEATALYLDEMANLLQYGNLHPKLEEWFHETVLNDFQEDFVADISPDAPLSSDGLPISLEWGLDDETDISIKILPLVEKKETSNTPTDESGTRCISIACLSPSFRIVQICESRASPDLEGIDAILGCPIQSPEPGLMDKLDSLSIKERHTLTDTMFHMVNWCRELVNAFASQTDPEMKGKVITRLHNITRMQVMLQKCLAVCKNYMPPLANFVLDDSKPPTVASGKATGGKRGRKPGKGKKGQADKENVNDSDEESRDSSVLEKETQAEKTQAAEKEDSTESSKVDLKQYSAYFRELDMDVFAILKSGLISRAALDTEMNTKATETVELKPAQLEFLLDDLVQKLSHALPATAAKRRTFFKSRVQSCGFSHIDELGPQQVATKAIQLLPALCQHLETTSAFFQAQIAANDGLVDGPGSNSEESQLMSCCFHLLLQAISALLSWSGFLLAENRSLMKEAMVQLASRLNESCSTQQPIQDLIRQAFNYLQNFSATLPTLTAAVTLMRLLVVVAEKSDSGEISTKIGDLSQGFLKREWLAADGTALKGGKHNEMLQQLLRLFFAHSSDVLGSLEDVGTVAIPELINAEKDGGSAAYPTLNKSSYPTYYRVMLMELLEAAKEISLPKKADSAEVKMDKLIQWNLAVRIFHILVNLIKVFDARSNLNAVLKYGRMFLEVFMRQALPMLDDMLRSHKDDVNSVIKNLQLSTRYLHHVSGHSKIMKDLTLTNQVPLLKRILEKFVLEVKAIFTGKGCVEAFWIGNLKNRDLKGAEIQSQASQEEESDNDSAVEDDEASDDDGDDDNSNQDSEAYQQSYSETY